MTQVPIPLDLDSTIQLPGESTIANLKDVFMPLIAFEAGRAMGEARWPLVEDPRKPIRWRTFPKLFEEWTEGSVTAKDIEVDTTNPFMSAPYIIGVSFGNEILTPIGKPSRTVMLDMKLMNEQDHARQYVCRYLMCEGYGAIAAVEDDRYHWFQTFKVKNDGEVEWLSGTLMQINQKVFEINSEREAMWEKVPGTLFSIFVAIHDRGFDRMPDNTCTELEAYSSIMKRFDAKNEVMTENMLTDTRYVYQVKKETKAHPSGNSYTEFTILLGERDGRYGLIDLRYIPEAGLGAIGLSPDFLFLDKFLPFEIKDTDVYLLPEVSILEFKWQCMLRLTNLKSAKK